MTLVHNAGARIDEERHQIRAAMSRLRYNKAERSDGAHTVVALAAESCVSRQRLYEQHSDLITEFKATIGRGPVVPSTAAVQRQLAQAREHNEELAAENTELRAKITTLSAVIAELTHDTTRANVVVPMQRKRTGGRH